MTYRQLTPEERYMLAALRRQGCNQSEIARSLGRHRSTVCREVRRNSTRADGHYRAFTAQERTNGRRSRSRRNQRFTASGLRADRRAAPQAVEPRAGRGAPAARRGQLSISHETIYRHVWRDKKEGGAAVHPPARGPEAAAQALRRLRQPRQAGGKAPDLGAAAARWRRAARSGHWEADTVMGAGGKDCVVTLVERKTGLVLVGKLTDRTAASLSRRPSASSAGASGGSRR